MKKLLCLLTILLLFTASASAIRSNFKNLNGTNDWFDGANWNKGVPTAADKGFIQTNGADRAIIGANGEAVVGIFKLIAGELQMDAGSKLTVHDSATFGDNGTGNVVTMNSATIDIIGEAFTGFANDATQTTLFTMNGSSVLNTPRRSNLGHGGIADLIMNDTSVWNTMGTIFVGNLAGAEGYLELNDSAQIVMDTGLPLNVGIDTTGDVQINGGSIIARDLILGSNGSIDIVSGYIELDYDDNPENTESWEAYKSRITAYGVTTGNGAGDAFFDIDDTNTVITIVPEPATFALIGAGLAFLRRKK